MKKIKGFSLAEALMALLIVSLITIATIPVITKKTRMKEEHGRWMCTIDKNTGKHIQWMTGSSVEASDSESWTVAGNRCTFMPPSKAKNFSITAVGGGGGGAAAYSEKRSWTSDFVVEYYGKYKFLAVAGGGEGGDSNCSKEKGTGGGGSGGIGYGEYEIDNDVLSVKMERGIGGDGGDYGGNEGSDSVITLVKRASSSDIIKAEGGEGGAGKWRNGNKFKACGGGTGKGGKGGAVTAVSGITKIPGKDGGSECTGNYCSGCISFSDAKKINDFMGEPLMTTDFANQEKQGSHTFNGCSKFQKGRGGAGVHTKAYKTWTFPKMGGHGVVVASTTIVHTGHGGKASVPDERFVPSFKDRKLLVVVGKGGKGGTNGGIGTSGGNTTVTGATTNTSYAKSMGVSGGTANYLEKAGMNTPGENGGKSQMYYNAIPAIGYGGLSGSNSSVDGMSTEGAGGGGGGGGASADGDVGNGADGAPGYVVIEW